MLKKIVPIGLSFLFASQAFSVSKSIMNCSRDQRPVDGILTQYEVIQDADKTYSLHHTVALSVFSSDTEPTTTILISSMKCTDPGAAVGRISLVCKNDQRHVGGALEKLVVVKNARQGAYALEFYREAGTGDIPTAEKSKKILDENIKCTFPK